MKLGLNPGLGAGVEQVEGQRSSAEDLVVEGADVELWPEFLLGAGAEFAEFELADLIGERLSRPRDVAVDLGLEFGAGEAVGLLEEGYGLLAGPALGGKSSEESRP